MTVRDLRKATAPYIDIEIIYNGHALSLTDNDYTTLQAFGDFAVDYISIKDEDTLTATLAMQAVKE